MLIPPYGMVGAAIATAAGYAVLAATQHVVAQRVYPTVYETGKLARSLVLAIAAGSVGLATIEPLWVSLLVKTLVCSPSSARCASRTSSTRPT